MSGDKNHVTLSVRCPIETHRKLSKRAKEEVRSISQQAVYYIQKAMEAEENCNNK